MRTIPFLGPSYESRSLPAACQRAVNLYLEQIEAPEGRGQWIMVGVPGKSLFCTLPTAPIRGIWKATGGRTFAVGGSTLYELTSGGTATTVGTLETNSGAVSFADNGIQVCLVDGGYGYILTLATNSFGLITDPDFTGADTVSFLDGYFLFNMPGTQKFQISALYDGASLDALDFASSEALPDNVVGQIADHREAWIFNEESTEVFYNSGNADFPLERIQGAVLEVGCLAAHSIAKLSNAVIWLGAEKSTAMVFMAQGYQPKRISTHAVEKALQELGDLSEAVAWTYQQDGHSFYCLNAGGSTTWVYDASTGQWHERQWRNPANAEMGRDRAGCHAYAFNRHLVGDYESGKIYELDQEVYTDNGDPLISERTSPHASDSMDWVFLSSFQVDMEVGVGLDGSGQGTDPMAMLSWSNDGGRTYSSEKTVSMGRMGEFKHRAIWRRLGRSRAANRVWKLRISDPVKRVLIGASADAEMGQ